MLRPNSSNAESNWGYFANIHPDGFELQVGGGVNFIYCAIRQPNKPPLSSAGVYKAYARTGTGTGATTTVTGVGFAPDLVWSKTRTPNGNNPSGLSFDRMRGKGKTLSIENTSVEYSNTILDAFNMDGYSMITGANDPNLNTYTYTDYFFRRAPGFFDIVAYTGTGVARTVPHNLGVVPEMMIVKRRDVSDNWEVYSSFLGNTSYLTLNNNGSQGGPNELTRWNSTTPSNIFFTLGTNTAVNGLNSTYISYLFATLPGISKVGSYTGTGAQLDIDAGFATGPAFLLIKRTDSTGDWYLWDSTRGIVSAGNDPYLLLNSTAAEVTNTNYIDPINTGFRLTSTAPAALNASGGAYIYYSVAKP